jgi:double-stranded uracil-DNA glycosylase
MTNIHSFPPISKEDSHVLLLGSMPGKESLVKNEYYAHSRNSFWRIMESVLGISIEKSYLEKTTALLNRGIALWDVLKTCTRDSSLDSDIIESSIICNNFEDFYISHPRISKVFFNGKKAEDMYMKYVWPKLSDDYKKIDRFRLPSTSPANASKTLGEKASIWKSIERTKGVKF